MNVSRLRRVRWAVRACLLLGVAASVAANVLHAEPNSIARTIAAWPPLALLLTIELIAKVPVTPGWRTWTRLVATAVIAGIAAYVSYRHMAGVALRYGEVPSSAYLLPLSVDGLVVIAAVSLVELAGRIAVMKPDKDLITASTTGGADGRLGNDGTSDHSGSRYTDATGAQASYQVQTTQLPEPATYNDSAVSLGVEPPPASSVIAPDVPSATGPAATSPVAEPVAVRRSRRPEVAEYRRRNPAAKQAEAITALAAEGVPARTVRHHWPTTAPVVATVNGRKPGSG